MHFFIFFMCAFFFFLQPLWLLHSAILNKCSLYSTALQMHTCWFTDWKIHLGMQVRKQVPMFTVVPVCALSLVLFLNYEFLFCADYLSIEDFPQHIKSLVQKEKESEEQEKRQREIERNTCKVRSQTWFSLIGSQICSLWYWSLFCAFFYFLFVD